MKLEEQLYDVKRVAIKKYSGDSVYPGSVH